MVGLWGCGGPRESQQVNKKDEQEGGGGITKERTSQE